MSRLIPFFRLILVAILLCLVSSCVYSRVLFMGVPSLGVRERFDNRIVHPRSDAPPLAQARAEAAFTLTPSEQTRYHSFDRLLEANGTRAFIAIHDDTLVYERYFGKVSRTTKLPSFSISKTYAALLVGLAVSDSLLESMDQSIVTYIPGLARMTGYEAVTLDYLLRMISGIGFQEESAQGAAFYYCEDLRARMYGYPIKWKPGTHYEYGSVNIQLLWDALHRRLGGRTVSEYFETRVWGPIGAEQPAEWSLDSKASGIEKFFGGFNATARDHARLGLLFLHGGVIDGRRIVPKEWVDRSLVPDAVIGITKTTDGRVRRTHYQWFMTLDERCYFAKGYHGQYIFVVPDRSAVFVRFGEGYGHVDWPALFVRLADEMSRQ